MNNTLKFIIGSVVVIALSVGLSVAFVPKSSPSLGGYNPPTVAAGGFSQTLSTSTVQGSGYFCQTQNTQYVSTSATGAITTSTLPSATTTFAACPNLQNLGAVVAGYVTNDSTGTINYVAGTGTTFRCETNGVGTSTYGLGVICTASQVIISGTSTVQYATYFDTNSSTQVVIWGNNFH